MESKTKIILSVGALLISGLLLAGCGKSNSGQPTTQPSVPPANSSADYTINQGELVFFWGQGCPHCENVEKFLQDNSGLEEKIKLKKIEVFNDPNGQKLFMEKVKECGLATAGVQVLYQDGKCTQGDQPIIEELKKNL